MSTQERVTRYTRGRRKKPMLNVDLNAAPPCETRSQEGISTRARSRDEQAGQQGDTDTIPAPIDLEAYEDDVIITSPGAFAEWGYVEDIVGDALDMPLISCILLNKKRKEEKMQLKEIITVW